MIRVFILSKYLQLLQEQKEQLLKAVKHLEYSYNKLNKIGLEINEKDDEILETWESFSARFSGVVDIFLAKYLRTFVLYHDPGFTGSLRDFINYGEKTGIITDVDKWLVLRELRNITAHEYTNEDIKGFYKRIYSEADFLLDLKTLLDQRTPCE